MAEEFILDWKVDHPALLAGAPADVYVLVTVRPNAAVLGALLEKGPDSPLPAHLIVLVDVSGSMQEIIRPDPHARVVGTASSEGRPVDLVETRVPTRLAVAQEVVRRLIGRMNPADRLTVVAFDHQAHTLRVAVPATRKGELERAVEQLGQTGGGGTSIGKGFEAVLAALKGVREEGTRRLVLLTDGHDNQGPEFALEQAKLLSTQGHTPIHAFGTGGDCRADFLKQIAQTSGAFNHIVSEADAEVHFDRVFTGQHNTLATHVGLALWLSPEIFVQELYRTRPEILYLGAMKPDGNNVLSVPVEYLERGKVYEFLFACKLPAREAGRRFRLARATLSYDLPALGLVGQKAEANIVVEYTADEGRARVRVGDVRRVIAQAEVQRQVLFLQEKIDLIERRAASADDRTTVARLLEALIANFQEFGDQASVNLYRGMRDEFTRRGSISQEMLNRSLASSSKPQEGVPAVQVLDF
jgi:Ca-activated chloride channel family protein